MLWMITATAFEFWPGFDRNVTKAWPSIQEMQWENAWTSEISFALQLNANMAFFVNISGLLEVIIVNRWRCHVPAENLLLSSGFWAVGHKLSLGLRIQTCATRTKNFVRDSYSCSNALDTSVHHVYNVTRTAWHVRKICQLRMKVVWCLDVVLVFFVIELKFGSNL